MDTLEKFNNWLSTSITIKLFSVGILILLLLIPKSMITSLISEREWRMEEAMREITKLWPGKQKIAGPILTIPYKEYYKDKEEVKYTIKHAHFLPENLNANIKIYPEERKRGIFKVVVYRSDIHLDGIFNSPDFSTWDIKNEDILWDKAKINIAIDDLRGLEKSITLKWNDSTHEFEPGLSNFDFVNTGISTSKLNLSKDQKKFKFDAKISLKGSQELFIEPIGKETEVNMLSEWADPSFNGAFLPDHYDVTEKGFSASWKVLHFNRSYPQKWTELASNTDKAAFGVALFQSASHYQKSTRTSKYAILLIALTFIVFFLSEVITRIKIHPFQYIMVGLALCLFYVLLLSVSEHIGFDLAYGIAALAIITLISLYSNTFFKSLKASIQMGLTLILFYGYMYALVRMENYALLAGSIGLLLILGILMYLTRKIDWYKGLNSSQKGDLKTDENG